jgi:CDP-diacylglycerol--serine O-phosphatidyltransferase
MKHLPNFITSLNLAAGFIAIVFVMNNDLITASWFILAAMVFDFLDGLVARAVKAYSALGKELDSLADLVSFGVAPGLIIFRLLTLSTGSGNLFLLNFSDPECVVFLTVSAVMPACAALRLARFNLDTTQTTSFKGLPTPANALAVISIVIGLHYSGSSLLSYFTGSPIWLTLFSLLLSIMMVSRIPLLSLKFSNLKIKGNEGRYVTIILCVLMILIFGIGSIPGIIPVYIVVSLFSRLF